MQFSRFNRLCDLHSLEGDPALWYVKFNEEPTKQQIYSATDPVGIGVKFETEFAGSSARRVAAVFSAQFQGRLLSLQSANVPQITSLHGH